MKKQLSVILGLLVLVSMLLGACAPAAPAAPPPPPPPQQLNPPRPPRLLLPPLSRPKPREAPAAPANSSIDKPLVVCRTGRYSLPGPPHLQRHVYQRSVGYWIFDVLVMNSQDGKFQSPNWPRNGNALIPTPGNSNWSKMPNSTTVRHSTPMQWSIPSTACRAKNSRSTMPCSTKPPSRKSRRSMITPSRSSPQKPFNDLLWYLSRTFIVPPGILRCHLSEEVAIKPVGSGPFKFVEWVKDDHITVVANEEYFQGAPVVKNAMVRVIPEASQRLNELTTGNVDLITNLPADLAKQTDSDNSRLVPYHDPAQDAPEPAVEE